MLLISNATGMIMSIAGLAKDIIVVVTSSMFFHAPVTAVQYGGYGITIAGMFIYKEYKQVTHILPQSMSILTHSLSQPLHFPFLH